MKIKADLETTIYDNEYNQYQVLSVKKPKAYVITYDGMYVRIKLVSLDNKVKWIPEIFTLRMCRTHVKKLNEIFNTDKFKCEELV